jgi:hypothetical protein
MPSWSDALSIVNVFFFVALGISWLFLRKYWEKYWEKMADLAATKEKFDEILQQTTKTAEAVKKVEILYADEKAYLDEKGKHRATKEDFDDFLAQLEKQTKITEGIRKDLQAEVARLTEWQVFVRELYVEGIRKYSSEQAQALRQAYLLLFEPESSTVSVFGKDRQELLDTAIQGIMQPLREHVGVLDESTIKKIYSVQNQLLNLKGRTQDEWKKKKQEFFTETEVARQFIKADKIAFRLGLISRPLRERRLDQMISKIRVLKVPLGGLVLGRRTYNQVGEIIDVSDVSQFDQDEVRNLIEEKDPKIEEYKGPSLSDVTT